jgi:hypothetical protein
MKNERPRGKPRGIQERNPQELRSKPRIHFCLKNAGQAAGYLHPARAG